MVVGVRAIGAEQHLEGPAWLLLIESEAFPVPEDLVHASAAQLVESTALLSSVTTRQPRPLHTGTSAARLL